MTLYIVGICTYRNGSRACNRAMALRQPLPFASSAFTLSHTCRCVKYFAQPRSAIATRLPRIREVSLISRRYSSEMATHAALEKSARIIFLRGRRCFSVSSARAAKSTTHTHTHTQPHTHARARAYACAHIVDFGEIRDAIAFAVINPTSTLSLPKVNDLGAGIATISPSGDLSPFMHACVHIMSLRIKVIASSNVELRRRYRGHIIIRGYKRKADVRQAGSKPY